MIMEHSRKIWLLVMLGLAAVFGILFAVLVRPMYSKANDLHSQYRRKVSTRQRFMTRPQGAPTDSLLRAVLQEDKLLGDTLTQAVSELGMKKTRLLPEAVPRPSIYWLDVLRKTRLALTRDARKAGMGIPRGLTFGNDIPSDEQVPRLLRKLTLVEELVGLGIKSGISSFSDLDIGNEEAVQSSGKDFLRKLNVNLSMTGTLDSLLNFIYFLQEADSFFIIEDMEIESSSEILKVKLVLSMLYFLSDENEPGETESPTRQEKHAKTRTVIKKS